MNKANITDKIAAYKQPGLTIICLLMALLSALEVSGEGQWQNSAIAKHVPHMGSDPSSYEGQPGVSKKDQNTIPTNSSNWHVKFVFGYISLLFFVLIFFPLIPKSFLQSITEFSLAGFFTVKYKEFQEKTEAKLSELEQVAVAGGIGGKRSDGSNLILSENPITLVTDDSIDLPAIEPPMETLQFDGPNPSMMIPPSDNKSSTMSKVAKKNAACNIKTSVKSLAQLERENKIKHLDDPQKDRWGGKSEDLEKCRKLSASVSRLSRKSSWYNVELTVESTNPKECPICQPVTFYLHDSFPKPKQTVMPDKNGASASVEVVAWGLLLSESYWMEGLPFLSLTLLRTNHYPNHLEIYKGYDSLARVFFGLPGRGIDGAQTTLTNILAKADFWNWNSKQPLNERQQHILNRLLEGFEGKLTTSKWAKLRNCSQHTAYCDI